MTQIMLKDYQRAGADVLCQRLFSNRRTLLCDEPGVGKSAQAIEVAKTVGLDRVIILTPNSVKTNWCEELTLWGVENYFLDPTTTPPKPSWLVLNYERLSILKQETLKKIKTEYKPRLIICDECHDHLRNPKSKRTVNFQYLINADTFVLGMTGTPIVVGSADFLDLVSSLWCEKGGIRFRRKRDLCRGFRKKIWTSGRKEQWTWDFSRGPEPGSAQEKQYIHLLNTHTIRRRKQDVLRELPELQRIVIRTNVGGDAKKLCRWGRKEVGELLRSGKREGRSAYFENLTVEALLIALGAIDRRELGLAKSAGLPRLLTDLGICKCVVFCHHREVAEEATRALRAAGHRSEFIHGGCDSDYRDSVISRFLAGDEFDVLVATVGTAGIGINLFAVNVCVFLEAPYLPSKIDQAISRLWRQGQERAVTAYFPVIENSLEEKIIKIVLKRESDFSRLVASEIIEELRA